jgi:hypothetical protein
MNYSSYHKVLNSYIVTLINGPDTVTYVIPTCNRNVHYTIIIYTIPICTLFWPIF